jgi:hypothetical protein
LYREERRKNHSNTYARAYEKKAKGIWRMYYRYMPVSPEDAVSVSAVSCVLDDGGSCCDGAGVESDGAVSAAAAVDLAAAERNFCSPVISLSICSRAWM